MTSILTSIKKMLGIEEEYTHFDPELIVHVNSALMSLMQIGIGAETGFVISDDTATWSDLLGESENLESVKLYIYYKVRMSFDPPTSSFVLESMERSMKEIEWRLMVEVDPPIEEEV